MKYILQPIRWLVVLFILTAGAKCARAQDSTQLARPDSSTGTVLHSSGKVYYSSCSTKVVFQPGISEKIFFGIPTLRRMARNASQNRNGLSLASFNEGHKSARKNSVIYMNGNAIQFGMSFSCK